MAELGEPYVFSKQDGQKYGRGLDVAMQRAFRRVGISSGGFHALRRTFATRAIEGGVDIESLRKLMGHSDTRVLMRYLHVRDGHLKRMTERISFGPAQKLHTAKAAG